MSDLTRLLDRMLSEDCDDFDTHNYGTVEPARALLALLPAHDAEIRAQAKREQMEADCRVACCLCQNQLIQGPAVFRQPFGAGIPSTASPAWLHGSASGYPCEASAIRAAWAKKHPEEVQDD